MILVVVLAVLVMVMTVGRRKIIRVMTCGLLPVIGGVPARARRVSSWDGSTMTRIGDVLAHVCFLLNRCEVTRCLY